MITIIGFNLTISKGIGDLVSSGHNVQFIKFSPDSTFQNIKLQSLVKNSTLLIINLDNIYQAALSLIGAIQQIDKTIRILALDIHKSSVIAQHLVQQGISAYLPITTNTEELSKAIEACLLGKTYIAVSR